MRRPRLLIALAVFIFVLTLLSGVTEQLVALLWMKALGYGAVFWKLLGVKAALFAVALVVATAFLLLQARFILRELAAATPLRSGSARLHLPGGASVILTQRLLKNTGLGVSLFFGFFLALAFSSQWDAWLRLAGSHALGEVDPIFGHDLSFYLLEFPFIEATRDALVGLTMLVLVLVTVAYFMLGRIAMVEGRFVISRAVIQHLLGVVMLLLALWAWGYYLDRYALLFSTGGIVNGAGYTDVHIRLPGLWIALAATLVLLVWIGLNLRAVRARLMMAGAVLWIVVLMGALWLVPVAVQQISVEPNELQRETPYLEHSIALTRRAYALDTIERRSYPATQTLDFAELADDRPTLRNIRLWDPRLLIQIYEQIQELRLYYKFYNVDVDRYQLESGYSLVMLSARELEQRLPNDTWVNRHLQFTHGYGLAMNLASQQGPEGTPSLIVKDVPPVTEEGIVITQPAIYYGEHTSDYRIVNSRVQELDYPKDDVAVAYTHYQGQGGVLLNSFWREVLFAWHFTDLNLILSGSITDSSRIQLWNRVSERVRRVAPFLQLDSDPYLVVSGGKLYWILDAFTTASTFPYSEPAVRGSFNYLRDAVKVVIDAYEGSVDLYVMDEDDPVLRAYRDAFPTLFQPLDALDADLRAHLRYPKDLFQVQIRKLSRYHMTEPQVFYNDEDLWEQPQEKYGSATVTIPMEPYYLLMRLPDEDKLEFLLMTPMTPVGRTNMIAWVAAKSDFPDYGKLVLYELPKDKLIIGPIQIEAFIDQDPEISPQLSLWGQQGSEVIRGNLLAVPVDQSFVYVEPVFLEAVGTGTEIPQLQRVIVAFGEQVTMQPTIEGALSEIFGVELPAPGDESPFLPGPSVELDQARIAFRRLERAFQAGDFAAFGRELDVLRGLLGPDAAPADSL